MAKVIIPSNARQELIEVGLAVSDVVLYLTSACNLRCKHCYIGNELLSQSRSLDLQSAKNFLCSFEKLDRLTLIGGEPLLYPGINEIVACANSLEILDRRITTNGTGLYHLKHSTNLNQFTVAVSIDGATSANHDRIRGLGTFEKTIEFARLIKSRCEELEVTTTINSFNISEFDEIIALAKSLEADTLNLHLTSMQGNAAHARELAVYPEQWIALHSHLSLMTINSKFKQLRVRAPIIYLNSADPQYNEIIEGYRPHAFASYYSEKGQRIVVYADGRLFISSELFGTEHYIGEFIDGKFRSNVKGQSELEIVQSSAVDVNDLSHAFWIPNKEMKVLSVSYKRDYFV